MDEQFNGRTDDDLFSDDFEPAPPAERRVLPDASVERHVSPEPPAAPEPKAPEPAPSASPAPTQTKPQPSQPSKAPAPSPQVPKSLAQSRHARPAPNNRPAKQANNAPRASPAAPASQPAAAKPPPTGPAASKEHVPNNKAGGDSRLGSGANPRTKLTDAELADKMEKMRILAAEKTRKFEEEKRDEDAHAAAYARGMEEARKRRAVEEEKRRRGDEERRRLEDERAKNRERKLQAMGMKEGGWDEGKQERLDEEEKRGFRGANGGVRGARGLGLSGSRYADGGEERGDFYSGDRGSRGRGRGRGGRGRGGRGGYTDGSSERNGNQQGDAGRPAPAQRQPAPKAEDFPALPASNAPKAETNAPAPLTPSAIPLSPPLGKWDEEVAAMEAKKNG